MGMGGAFVAISDDASGAFVNPAGLTQLQGMEGHFMYAKPFAGLEGVNFGLGALALAAPLGEKNALALTASNFSASGLLQETVASLSYAREISRLSLGVSAKYLYHSYKVDTNNDPIFSDGTSKGAFTADLGALLKLNDRISVGATGRNLIKADVGLKTEDVVPMEYQAGIASSLIRRGLLDLTGTLDVSYRDQDYGSSSDKMDIHAGLENWFADRTFAFRLGGSKTKVTAGASLLKPMGGIVLGIDYAFQMDLNLTEDNYGTHRVGLVLKMGGSSGSSARLTLENESVTTYAPTSSLESQAVSPAVIPSQEVRQPLTQKPSSSKRLLMSQHYNRAVAYYKKGQYRSAVMEWKEVLKLDPRHKASKDGIARAQKKLGAQRTKRDLQSYNR